MRTPSKLMTELTGQETYAAVYSCFLARLAGKQPPFTDNDLDTAINGLEKRRPEYAAYYRWCYAGDVIDRMQGEIRVLAMQSCWRFSLLTMQITGAMKTAHDAEPKPSHQPEALAEMVRQIADGLHNITLMQIVLEAFAEVLELDLMILVRRELRQVEQCLQIYQAMAEHYDDDQTFRTGAKELLEGVLPRLTMNPDSLPADFKQQVIDAIHHHKRDNLLDVLDVMLPHYREPEAVQ